MDLGVLIMSAVMMSGMGYGLCCAAVMMTQIWDCWDCSVLPRACSSLEVCWCCMALEVGFAWATNLFAVKIWSVALSLSVGMLLCMECGDLAAVGNPAVRVLERLE
ncbi:unnamed protein product [Camellia sinensis]